MNASPCGTGTSPPSQRPNRAGGRLSLPDTTLVIGGSIEKRFVFAAEGEALGEVGGFIEFAAQPIGFGEVVVAQADLDLEFGIFLGQRPHPLLDLTPPIAIAIAFLQIAQQ